MLWATAVYALPGAPGADLPEEPGPYVVRVFFTDAEELRFITRNAAPWLVDHRAGFVLLESDRKELQRLAGHGLRFFVDEAWTARAASMRGFATKSIPGFGCYRLVEETRAAARSLERNRPDLVERIEIGQSWRAENGQGGYPIEVVRISNETVGEPRPAIFINAAIHAREYSTAEVVTRFAEALVNDYETDPQASWLLDHREIHMVLVANPDGRKHAESGILWRKNANTNHCGSGTQPGVDLNRNFPFGWGQWDGSSGDPCAETFRGPVPASEPETQALEGYLKGLFGTNRPADLVTPAPPETPGVFIDVHSFGRLVLYPWGFPGQSVPNNAQLRTMAAKMAFFNRHRAANSLYLYPTDGTTTDYTYGELGVASFTFELGDRFFEHCRQFDDIFEGNEAALRYAAAAADEPYRRPYGPDVSGMHVLPNIVVPGESVQVRLAGDDSRYGSLGGVRRGEAIDRFEVRFERPGSTEPIGAPLSRAAVAGAGEIVLATDTLLPDRYRVVARARDEGGHWGVWRAAWLDVVESSKTGVIAGQVRSAADNRPVAAVIGNGQVQTTSDPESGQFRLRVPAGVHRLTVSAEDFSHAAVAEVDVGVGEHRERNVTLSPFCEVFAENAENGLDRWRAEGEWGVTDEDAYEGDFSITDSPGGNYADNTRYSLISPEIDLTGFDAANLRFFFRCETERDMDIARVITRRGESARASQALTCTGDSADWRKAAIDLADYVGLDRFNLQFRMDTDAEVNSDGFYVDDIRILGRADACPEAAPPEYALSGELTGTWFDPGRTGEGFVFEIGETERGPVLVVTWYTHDSGAPLWLIGSTPVAYRQSSATVDLFRGEGTGFGEEFDPEAVALARWGELTVNFRSATAATVQFERAEDGLAGAFDVQRLSGPLRRRDTDPASPRRLLGNLSGAWYEPDRPGQGLTVEFSQNADGPVAVVTWYTYADGAPVWLIGSVALDSDARRVVVPMSSFAGTGFGPAFDGAELQATEWGDLALEFESCGRAHLEYRFGQGAGAMDLARLTGGLPGVRCFGD